MKWGKGGNGENGENGENGGNGGNGENGDKDGQWVGLFGALATTDCQCHCTNCTDNKSPSTLHCSCKMYISCTECSGVWCRINARVAAKKSGENFRPAPKRTLQQASSSSAAAVSAPVLQFWFHFLANSRLHRTLGKNSSQSPAAEMRVPSWLSQHGRLHWNIDWIRIELWCLQVCWTLTMLKSFCLFNFHLNNPQGVPISSYWHPSRGWH